MNFSVDSKEFYEMIMRLLLSRADMDFMRRHGVEFLRLAKVMYGLLLGGAAATPTAGYVRGLPNLESFFGEKVTKTLVDRAFSLFMGSDVSGLRIT